MTETADRLLTTDETCKALADISRSTLWGMVRSGKCPPPRQITSNRVGFVASEISALIQSLPVSACFQGVNVEGSDNGAA